MSPYLSNHYLSLSVCVYLSFPLLTVHEGGAGGGLCESVALYDATAHAGPHQVVGHLREGSAATHHRPHPTTEQTRDTAEHQAGIEVFVMVSIHRYKHTYIITYSWGVPRQIDQKNPEITPYLSDFD